MNTKILSIFGVLSACAVSIHGVDWSLAGGTLIATGTGATSTFALGPALVAGLLVAKVFGLGLLVSNLSIVSDRYCFNFRMKNTNADRHF